MDRFTIDYCREEADGAHELLLRGKQAFLVQISQVEDARALNPLALHSDINNHIAVSSLKNSAEAFPLEMLVHYALNRASLKNYSVSVHIFEPLDSHELLAALLCCFGRICGLEYEVRQSVDSLQILLNDALVCDTFV
ncbi:hypothetical protein PAPHI01_0560 [Pancytospora philotis]|nr:hypothetical protein PAPHI01_0560 [Pancytospora philotis]